MYADGPDSSRRNREIKKNNSGEDDEVSATKLDESDAASDRTYSIKNDNGDRPGGREKTGSPDVDPLAKVERFLASEGGKRGKKREERREKRRLAARNEKIDKIVVGRRRRGESDGEGPDGTPSVGGKSFRRKTAGVRKSRRKTARGRERERKRRLVLEEDEEEEKELPITEILRKAQKKTRSSSPPSALSSPPTSHPLSPLSLPSSPPLGPLNADKIYVQGKNGFSVKKMSENWADRRGSRSGRDQQSYNAQRSVKVALVGQSLWNSAGIVHQGLLAGIALAHFASMQTIFRPTLEFLIDYSFLMQLYTHVFSYLVTVCVVCLLDRFDLAQFGIEYLCQINYDRFICFVALVLYVAAFSLHQAGLMVDQRVALLDYLSAKNATSSETLTFEDQEGLIVWQKISLVKDALAVSSWLAVAFGARRDSLHARLNVMLSYLNPGPPS